MEKLIIVVSGPPGTGTSTVSKKLAEKLKLDYFSFGELHKKLFGGWEGKEAKAALEVWKTPEGVSYKTHKERDLLQMKIAEKGDIVICGKLSIHFLKKLTLYKIWIEASLETRAKRAARRDKISFEEALSQISEREGIERENWKKIYGFDYFDQKKDADFAIDTSDLTINQVVNKILSFIKGR